MQYKKKKQHQPTPGNFNAIIVVKYEPGMHYSQMPDGNGYIFLKYRNISKDRNNFLKFAAKFPGAEYINFYDAVTKKYIDRIYLK